MEFTDNNCTKKAAVLRYVPTIMLSEEGSGSTIWQWQPSKIVSHSKWYFHMTWLVAVKIYTTANSYEQ